MARRLLLLFLFFMNFGIYSAYSVDNGQILVQKITQQQAENFDITIPLDTKPGFHSITVEVSNANLVVERKIFEFCKNLSGEIHWDNICPDLLTVELQVPLKGAEPAQGLAKYDPLSEPEKTSQTIVVAFAALTVLAACGTRNIVASMATTSASGVQAAANATKTSQQGFLAQLSKGSLLLVGAQLGRGDQSRSWHAPFTSKLDGAFTSWANRVSGISPLFARIVADANYLRAMIGSISILTVPIAVLLGVAASASVHHQALPPAIPLLIAAIFLGVLDAFAGAIAFLTFVMTVAIAGNISSLDQVLTLIGVSLIGISPILLASEFRPLRRHVSGMNSFWERASDYVLASILTGWLVEKMVEGLPGLSGLALPIATHGREIGAWAAAFILARFAGEDLASYLYPSRLTSLAPQFRERSHFQEFATIVVKIGLFALVAGQFIGVNPQLWIGTAMFGLPLALEQIGDRFPKNTFVAKWMPKGAIEIILMTSLGTIFAMYLQSHIHGARAFVISGFVLLGIPGLVLSLINLFGEETNSFNSWKESKSGSVFYRIGGVFVLIGLVYVVFEGNILNILR